jgi:hypothetical protein
VHHLAALVQHLPERDALHGRGRQVVHRDPVRSATDACANLSSSQ